MLTIKKELHAFDFNACTYAFTCGSVPTAIMLRLATRQVARALHVQSERTKIDTFSLRMNKKVAPRIESLPGRWAVELEYADNM